MKTKGQKIGELIDKLDNGTILFKLHGDPIWNNKEFLFKYGDYYDIRGWGTAYGAVKDRLFELMMEPDNWEIFPNFNLKENDYPFPWSVGWEEQIN